MRAVSGGEALVRALEDEGVDLVFGIPGTHSLPIYRHLEARPIRHVTPRHEQGGGYAADGYARAGGRPGVLLATTGPGLMNAATPAATAWADSVPMLIVSPALPSDVEGGDTGFLHESKDQRGAMSSLLDWSHSAVSPADAYAAVRRAFAGFAQGRPRPAHVAAPLDVLDAVESLPDGLVASMDATPLDEDAVDRAAGALSDGDRVALLLGGGAKDAGPELTALAERLGAPVLTSANGKGVVSESHPLSLGVSLRLRSAQEWLADRDVVLAVGTELGESDLWGPPPRLRGRLIRVDIDAGQLDKNLPSAIGIVGDSARVAGALLDALPGRGPGRSPDLTGIRRAIEAELLRDAAPWVGLCAALEGALGEDGLLAADSTMAAYHGAVHLVRLTAPRRLLYPTGYATLGYGLPAGVGAKLARPDRSVIVLSGDGGLMFTVAELVTAAELDLPLPIVVPNDGGYGEIRRQMRGAGIEPVGVDLAVPDLPALAVACGGRGERLSTVADLPAALDRAQDHAGPTLIELPVPRIR
jgi:thiamine pyrophosphate-dependent acetolactate synthase large subunit-like protein